MRASVHVVTKDRPDALALLIESLRQQTYKQWDLVILDNSQQIKVTQNHILMCLFKRLEYEGHRVFIFDNSGDGSSRDIGRYRNLVIEHDPFAVIDKPDQNRTNEIGVRIDDDSILEKNYLEILMFPFIQDSKNERMGYIVNGKVETDENSVWPNVGIVGGIVPYFWAPMTHALIPFKMNQVTRFFDWTDNCINFYRMLDKDGNDLYWTKTFFEAGHVRSSYAYRIDLAREIKFPEWCGPTGFTEETVFCIKAWMKGYKVLFNPNAICWHLAVPHGGGRDTVTTQEQMEEVKKTNMARLKKELVEFRDELKLEPRSYP